MELSKYFTKTLSQTRVINGLKDNLKSLDLFDSLNVFFLEKEKSTCYKNYIKQKEVLCYSFTEEELRISNELNPFILNFNENPQFIIKGNFTKECKYYD